MNIDKYNDAIKKKLESIEPKFEENDWDEMKSFMALNVPKGSIWSRYSRLFLYSTGAILLLSSLFFNIKQNYDNTSLLKINELLVNKTGTKQATQTQIVYQTDTVYLTKYITKWRTIDNTIAQSDLDGNLKTIDGQPFITNNQIIDKEMKAALPSPIKENQTNQNTVTISKLGVENKNNLSKDVENIQPLSQATNGITNQILEPTNLSENTLKIAKNELISDSKIQNLSEINRIPFNQNVYLWTKQDPKINFITKMPVDALAQRKHITIKLPSISLVNLKYRVGVSFDVGNEQIGGSLLSDVLLSKHWSMNAGLRFLNITGNSYYTSEQFLFVTKQDFRQLYAPYIPVNYDIINLDFQNYLLQIPFGITYRYPLRNDITLLFSATTDLDLFVRQYINFDYKEDNSKFEQGTFKSTLPKSLLSNLEFSAGIEKKYNRMIFQVHPYISTQLRETVYKKEEFVFGAKMRFFVNLGK
ncbi:hypothetical protein GCM10011514_10420 [Emticicia aquatilis]|uniref:Outer membrane protein beta-barrel domain-containing protein n=1 Tax=Emticicia aquatilis TaxID=1537369 RepID=A0A916YJW5_9BACT|nr:hypothetical protein [Emticicia aquatilis]GGD48302.1 hypothetical protein GCM10011514_10420 [Emticicia aquatilis]